jgi:hypothetical protein
MKLSERIQSGEWKFNQPSLVKEVEQLEAELEQRRTQIAHLQPVYLEVCEENEALRKLIQDEFDFGAGEIRHYLKHAPLTAKGENDEQRNFED